MPIFTIWQFGNFWHIAVIKKLIGLDDFDKTPGVTAGTSPCDLLLELSDTGNVKHHSKVNGGLQPILVQLLFQRLLKVNPSLLILLVEVPQTEVCYLTSKESKWKHHIQTTVTKKILQRQLVNTKGKPFGVKYLECWCSSITWIKYTKTSYLKYWTYYVVTWDQRHTYFLSGHLVKMHRPGGLLII